jgi:hypothetical protein
MKIKIRTKEGEFVGDFPDVIKVTNKMITTLWENGIESTETPMVMFHGFEVIEQVADDSEVTLPVQERQPVLDQWKFQILNLV